MRSVALAGFLWLQPLSAPPTASVVGEDVRPSDVQLSASLGEDVRRLDATTVAAWPQRPGQWIFAGATTESKDGDVTFRVRLALLEKNATSLRVVSRADNLIYNPEQRQPAQLVRISLDTARWQISPTELAFGLRIAARVGAAVAHEGQEDLYLFVPRGADLHPVFHDVAATWSGDRNPDTLAVSNERRETRIYTLSKHRSHGHFDLVRTSSTGKKAAASTFEWDDDENGGSYPNPDVE